MRVWPARLRDLRAGIAGRGQDPWPPALLALAALLAVLNLAKAFNPNVQDWGAYLWRIDYAEGFVKRGLLGTLFREGAAAFGLPPSLAQVPGVHLGLLAVLVVLLAALVHRAWQAAGADPGRRRTVAALAVMLAGAPVLPTLAMLTGYPDAALATLFLGSALLAARGYVAGAALLALPGPLLHEGFVFLWAPLALWLLWRRPGLSALAWGVLPLLAAGGVLLAHDPAAVDAVLARPGIDPQRAETLRGVQFGQTVPEALARMTSFYAAHWGNVLKALLYFLPPLALSLTVAVADCSRDRRSRGLVALALLVGAAGPAAVLALAWDLSRFLNWAVLGGWTLALLTLAVVWARPESAPARGRPAVRIAPTLALALALALALFYTASPNVYAYFGWARGYAYGVPPVAFDNPAAALTARFVAWYNAPWIAGQSPRAAGCDTPAQRAGLSCPGRLNEGETWESQPRLMRPGRRAATWILARPSGCTAPHLKLGLHLVGAQSRPLAQVRVTAGEGGPLRLEVPVRAITAAMGHLVARLSVAQGCVAVRSLRIE